MIRRVRHLSQLVTCWYVNFCALWVELSFVCHQIIHQCVTKHEHDRKNIRNVRYRLFNISLQWELDKVPMKIFPCEIEGERKCHQQFAQFCSILSNTTDKKPKWLLNEDSLYFQVILCHSLSLLLTTLKSFIFSPFNQSVLILTMMNSRNLFVAFMLPSCWDLECCHCLPLFIINYLWISSLLLLLLKSHKTTEEKWISINLNYIHKTVRKTQDRRSIVRNTNNIKSDEKIMKISLPSSLGWSAHSVIEKLTKGKISLHQNFFFMKNLVAALFNQELSISNCFWRLPIHEYLIIEYSSYQLNWTSKEKL